VGEGEREAAGEEGGGKSEISSIEGWVDDEEEVGVAMLGAEKAAELFAEGG
jgi:hypothetical protein